MNKTLDYYNKNADKFSSATASLDLNKLYKPFLSHIKKEKAAILDFGCGTGRDSLYFKQKGFDVVAVDGSKELCDIASRLIKQEVICKEFKDFQSNTMFDGVWACSSLLHVPNNEIYDVIKNIAGMLKDKGCFYVSFKYGDFEGERNGRFFADYNENKVEKLLSAFSSMKIVETRITTDVRKGRETEKWLNVIAIKQTI